MSKPENIKTLQTLLGDYSDFSHEFYLKFVEQFQKGFSLNFNVMMRDGDDFDFFFISFFENHSNKFKLLNSSSFHRDYPNQVPIWRDDELRFRVLNEKGEEVVSKDFRFADLESSIVDKCFNEDLMVLNPNIKYQGQLTLLKEGQSRTTIIKMLASVYDEAARQKRKLSSEFVSLVRQANNEDDESTKANHIQRLQLRLQFWGYQVDLSKFDTDPHVKKILANLTPIDFGVKDLYALSLLRKNLLLPLNNESLVKAIEKMAKDQEKSLEKLMESLVLPTEPGK